VKLALIVGFTTALALGSTAQASQFVVNGDFTQLSNGVGQVNNNTTVTGWTDSANGYNFIFSQADQASPGQYGGVTLWDQANGGTSTWNGLAAGPGNFAALDGAFQNAALTQTITGLTVGNTYDLSFAYAFSQQNGFDGDTIQNLTVSLGAISSTSPDYNLPSHNFSGWGGFNALITATSTSEVLSFLAYGNKPVPPFALVSNVSLTSVPEPATWAMMLIGLGGLGALARRRRALQVAA